MKIPILLEYKKWGTMSTMFTKKEQAPKYIIKFEKQGS